MTALRMTDSSKRRLRRARDFCMESPCKESMDYMLTLAYYRGANDMEVALKVMPLEKHRAIKALSAAGLI